MKTKIIIILLALFAAKSHAISVSISADDFTVGTQIGETSGITLSQEILSNGHISNFATSVTRDQNAFTGDLHNHNHFSGSSYIYDLYINELSGPYEFFYSYDALSVDFSATSRFTGVKIKAEATSGSPMGLLAYDKHGNLRASSVFHATWPRHDDFSLDYFFDRDFGFELGSIKVGSLSDAAYVYEITAYAPEPSLLHLLFFGLLLVAFRQKLTSAK